MVLIFDKGLCVLCHAYRAFVNVLTLETKSGPFTAERVCMRCAIELRSHVKTKHRHIHIPKGHVEFR